MESINQIKPRLDKLGTSPQSDPQSIASQELFEQLGSRMARVQALKKHVQLTPEDAQTHLAEWVIMVRQFSLRAFDEALTRCVRESPYWPDPADLWKRLCEGNGVDGEQVDPNDAYWKEFNTQKKAVEKWKQSPEYKREMIELREQAAEIEKKAAERRRSANALASVRMLPESVIPTLPKDVERAFIAECIARHEATNRQVKSGRMLS